VNWEDTLTKVLSIKDNKNTTIEDVYLKKLIDKNENFALFDNGYLYAKKAHIEGEINATSGTI
jgi:hypothetical protein